MLREVCLDISLLCYVQFMFYLSMLTTYRLNVLETTSNLAYHSYGKSYFKMRELLFNQEKQI